MVNVSSVLVGGERGGLDAVGVGVGVGERVGAGVEVGIAVGDGVGLAVTLSVRGGDADDSIAADVCSLGVAVAIGVGDVAAFDGAGVGVGVLRDAGGEDFNFGFGRGVGFGVGVCALRSTPRREPRPTATSVLAAVADGFTRGLKEERNDRFGVGVGVGVGVDAALTVNATPSINADVGKINFRFMQPFAMAIPNI